MHFRAEKDIPSYIDLVDDRLKSLSDKIADQLEEQRLQQELMEAQQRAAEEAERERLRMVKLERKTKAAAAAAGPKGQGRLEKNDFTTTSLVLFRSGFKQCFVFQFLSPPPPHSVNISNMSQVFTDFLQNSMR